MSAPSKMLYLHCRYAWQQEQTQRVLRPGAVIRVICAGGGVFPSFYAETPSGATVVLLALGAFLLVNLAAALRRRRDAAHARAEAHAHEHGPGCGHEAVAHGDHVDYLANGHLPHPH